MIVAMETAKGAKAPEVMDGRIEIVIVSPDGTKRNTGDECAGGPHPSGAPFASGIQ